MSWIVSAPSRLHFGLIDLTGDRGRIDGGAGVALAQPRVVVRARRGTGRLDLPDGVAPVAQGIADRLRIDLGRLDLRLIERFPAHVGLGSHTQLALALGTAMSRAVGLDATTREIAAAAGRGGTSGIGVNVFDVGGLIVDGGHAFGPGREKETCRPSSASQAGPAPLLARYELPDAWRFALVTPWTEKGAHGEREVGLFKQSFPLPAADTSEVCRVVLMALMPGAATGDIELFGHSLTALQEVGFKKREVALQPPPVVSLLRVMCEAGAAGAGLSSFGPTVYAVAADQARASAAAAAAIRHLRRHSIEADAWTTAPDHGGAVINQTAGGEE